MSNPDAMVEWVNRAEEDYQLSRISLRRKSPLTYGATFHAQQCAEKYIKALLTIRQIAYPHTHDLAALNTLCQRNGILLPVSEDDLDRLSAFAVEVRYPGIHPNIEEAREALHIAHSVRKFIRDLLGL
jgi:HEPN domain-containing protein